jgi:hypothetical protein
VRGEGVALETEGADPHFASDIDLAIISVGSHAFQCGDVPTMKAGNLPVRVENCLTRPFTRNRLIQDRREIFAFLQRRIESRDGHDGPSRLDPAGRPRVPREPYTCLGSAFTIPPSTIPILAGSRLRPSSKLLTGRLDVPSRSSTSSKLPLLAILPDRCDVEGGYGGEEWGVGVS